MKFPSKKSSGWVFLSKNTKRYFAMFIFDGEQLHLDLHANNPLKPGTYNIEFPQNRKQFPNGKYKVSPLYKGLKTKAYVAEYKGG